MLLPALLTLAVGCQAPSQGLERMIAELEARTAARREAAAAAWEQHRDAFLLTPTRATMEPLLTAAPEIQDPALDHLRAWLDGQKQGRNPVDAVLVLLGRSMDGGGADRLAAMMDELPEDRRPEALRMAVERGGRQALREARARRAATDPKMRQAALQALLLHAPEPELPALMASLQLPGMDLDALALTFDELAKRALPEDFRVPEACLQSAHAELQASVVRLLAAHPQDKAEDFLVERSLRSGLSAELRGEALAAFVAGYEPFRWRDGERALLAHVKDAPRSSATEQVAWSLWRLGNKSAKKFLLDDLEDQVRANPDDHRVALRLARRQVDLEDFNDAYRTFTRIIDAMDDGLFGLRMEPEDWFYASRAAAATRHSREAGEWLERTAWGPTQLAPYRGLEEFSSYLDKQPFKRLFGE